MSSVGCRAVLFLSVLATGAGACGPAQDRTPAVLTTVQQIRAIDAADGERGYPVRLQGIVTYYHPQSKSLIVQAGTEGIFVDTGKTEVPVTAGQEIVIEGSTGPGESSVIVIANKVTVVKAGTMPAAEPVSVAELSSGVHSYRRVQAEGIVRSTMRENDGRLTLNVTATDGSFQVRAIGGSVSTSATGSSTPPSSFAALPIRRSMRAAGRSDVRSSSSVRGMSKRRRRPRSILSPVPCRQSAP